MPSTFKILTYRQFEPTEISGLKAWYDASTLTGTDGSSVSQWLDSSGNQAHMFQPSATAQPTLQTNELNGRNVVRFDGSDDFMNLTAPLNYQPLGVASANSCAWSKTGNYLIHSALASPVIYKISNKIFYKLNDLTPLTSVTSALGSSWSENDNYLFLGTAGGVRFFIFKRSDDSFTKLSDPSILPNGTIYAIDNFFDGINTYVACSGGGDKLFLYKNNGTNDIFNPLSAPAVLPTGTQSTYVKFSPDGNFLYVSSNAAPFLTFYQRVGDTFTKLNNPSTALTASGLSADWIDNQNLIIGITSAIPRIYTWDGTTFQQGSQVGSFSSSGNLQFDSSKIYLAIATGSTPFIRLYKRTGSTYSLLNNPSSIPSSTGRGISWSPDSKFLSVSHVNAPFLQIFERSEDNFINLNRLNLLRNVGGATIVAVKKNSNYVNTSNYVFVSNNSTVMRAGLQTGGNMSPYNLTGGRRTDSDSFQSVTDNTSADFNYQIVISNFNFLNTDLKLFVNGSLKASTNTFQTSGSTSDTDSNNIRIAYDNVNSFFNGDIAEIMIFNKSLSDLEIFNIKNYLSIKYDIAIV